MRERIVTGCRGLGSPKIVTANSAWMRKNLTAKREELKQIGTDATDDDATVGQRMRAGGETREQPAENVAIGEAT